MEVSPPSVALIVKLNVPAWAGLPVMVVLVPDGADRARPGGRLPAERDLAADYQVAVGTARRAVEELRQRGLVVTLPAKGTFVT